MVLFFVGFVVGFVLVVGIVFGGVQGLMLYHYMKEEKEE